MRKPWPVALLASLSACGGSGAPGARPSPEVARGPVELPRADSAPLRPVEIPRAANVASRALSTSSSCASASVAMKVLVLSADGREADLQAVTDSLDYLGMPYDARVVTFSGLPPLTSAGDPCAGNYVGIMLTTSALGYSGADGWASALTADQWEALTSYEATFDIREVDWYTYPTTGNGFAGATTAISPTSPGHPVSLTPAGQFVFYYLASVPDLQFTYVYLAKPAATAIPLITDAAGNALAVIDEGGGRQQLLLTFDNGPYLGHSIALGVGLVDWVTRGLYIGEHRGRFVPQIDDLFDDDQLWDASSLRTSETNPYRMSADDFRGAAAWQRARSGAGVRLAWAFNGAGAASSYGGTAPSGDPLTQAVRDLVGGDPGAFSFIDHTYDHWSLDGTNSLAGAPLYTSPSCGHDPDLGKLADCESAKNAAVARALDLDRVGAYSPSVMVSPELSGLANGPVLDELYATTGVRFMVSDSSRTGYANDAPSSYGTDAYAPNTILVDASSSPASPMLLLPRHPSNLFFNVSTPAEWVSEYNWLYGPGSASQYWPSRGLCVNGCTYQFILDKESDVLSTYLLKGDIDPLMFHQANLRQYPGGSGKSLLSDLLEATLAKVSRTSRFPLTSPQMQVLGAEMLNRALVRQGHASGTLSAVLTIASTGARTLTFTNSSRAEVKVRVTGLCNAGHVEVLGRCIGSVDVPAGSAGALATVSVGVP